MATLHTGNRRRARTERRRLRAYRLRWMLPLDMEAIPDFMQAQIERYGPKPIFQNLTGPNNFVWSYPGGMDGPWPEIEALCDTLEIR